MTKATATPNKDVPVRKTAAPAPQAESRTEPSGPVWKTQRGRVQGALWKHLQSDGNARFTVAISRSYKDGDDGKWKNVHYFDHRDLNDVRAVCDEADEQIL